MKILLIVLFCLYPFCCIAKVRAVVIPTAGPIILASTSNSAGKDDKKSVMLHVPATAIKVVYMISTYGSSSLRVIRQQSTLLSQVNDLLDKGGINQVLTNVASLKPSSASALIDANLFLDDANSQIFMLGQSAGSVNEYSRYNFTGGAIIVNIDYATKGKSLWVGMKNLSEVTGITVIIEAIALVDDGK